MDKVEKPLLANEPPKKKKLHIDFRISDVIDMISDSLILTDTSDLDSRFKSTERIDWDLDFTPPANITDKRGKFENKRSFKRGRDIGTFVEDLGRISRPNSPKTQSLASPKEEPNLQTSTLKITKKVLENSLEIIKKISIPKHKVKAMRIFIGKKTKHKPNRFKNSILPPIIKKLNQKKLVLTTNDIRNNQAIDKEIEQRSATPCLDYKPNSAHLNFFRLRKESKETAADDSSNEERLVSSSK